MHRKVDFAKQWHSMAGCEQNFFLWVECARHTKPLSDTSTLEPIGTTFRNNPVSTSEELIVPLFGRESTV